MLAVAHNLTAMNAQRQFNIVTKSKAKSTEKLSSGYRVNRAADDAAGLAISEKMRRQIRGLSQGASNIQDGIGLCQVADGALGEVQDMLDRMTELSIKASNDTLTDTDRGYIQKEVDQLISEIDRIGSTTSFNENLIFDKSFIESKIGKITNLVESPGADAGYLKEAFNKDGKWHPSASVDFSNITPGNINSLNGGFFSFNCSINCGEVFFFKLTTNGSPSSAKNLTGAVKHEYSVDVSDCTSGSQIVDKICNFVAANPPSTVSGISAASGVYGVSHSNSLTKSADGNSLIIFANDGYSTETAAKNAYPKSGIPRSGAVDVSGLTSIMTPEPKYHFTFRCSSNEGDYEHVSTFLMNAEAIGVKPLNVTTLHNAENAIEKVKKAKNFISTKRTDFGVQQNRLEHAYNINKNVEENTTSSESKIRDTDMANEMVAYSLKNILEQAGISMMTQANQSNQGILALLQ